jgi:spore germination protein KC
MSKRTFQCFISTLSLLVLVGCWDRTELNDQAIWLATGFDVGKENGVQISGQIAIPSNMYSQNGGSQGKDHFIVSENGENLGDAIQKIQSKLSRKGFYGLRKVFFIGEEFAKRGIGKELDNVTRGSEVSIRTDVFIVKGDTAIKVLNISNPLEKPPAIAAFKEHEQLGGRGTTVFLDFLNAANSDGIRPTIPLIEITKAQAGGDSGSEQESLLKVAGVGIFNKELKLVGMLNQSENQDLLWVLGYLEKRTLSTPLRDGNTTLQLEHMSSKIKPFIDKSNHLTFKVELSGTGTLFENNTTLNPEKKKDLKELETAFNELAKKQVLSTIKKVQSEFGQDIFGFGEVIHRKEPRKWKDLKDDWDQYFTQADVKVKTKIDINNIGITGPSVLYKNGGS